MTTTDPQRALTIPGDPMRRASKPRPLGTLARYAFLFGGVGVVAVAWVLMLAGGPPW